MAGKWPSASRTTVFVVGLEEGEARRATTKPGYVLAVSWSPTSDWITYTRQYGTTSVVSLVRPDGSDDHEISPSDPSAEAAAAVWSPDGAYPLVQRANAGARTVGATFGSWTYPASTSDR